ncbi:MAG: cation:proton antiporter [Myxococcales bacterium]|nr:cation:proton antiporter [Myxococcales bacterium]
MQPPFTAAPHDVVLLLLVQMVALLVTARVLGEVAQRFKLPSVVGEILAGIVLGPSVLSGMFPLLAPWFVPGSQIQGYLLELVSLIGAMFLLLLTGLEIDLELIRRRARTAIGVSFGGILTTLSSGFVLGYLLPEDMRAEGASRLVFAMFMAIAMSISAIPVIAKVLMDLKVMRRDIGQTIIAAGMSDDTIGWILLSVVAALAMGETVSVGSVGTTVVVVLGFMLLSFTVGSWLVERLVWWVQDRAVSSERLVSLVVAMAFAWGALAMAAHMEAVLGAFIVGILFGRVRRLPREVVHKLEGMGMGVFAPIFFAVAGLKVDLSVLTEPRLLGIALLVILVASVGKFTGTYLGARLIGKRPHLNALAYGAGLNARGAMEILIATIGLRLGVLSPPMFSVIVVMAIVTSLMAPPALRWLLLRIEPDAQEQDRMRREEIRSRSLLGRLTRALVPVRTRSEGAAATQSVEAYLLGALDKDLALTIMTVTTAEQRPVAQDYVASLRRMMTQREVTTRVVVGDSPANAILDEAARDYDILVMGAPELSPHGEMVFNPVVDAIVRSAPCPTLVISCRHWTDDMTIKRILVPSTGLESEKTAAELAFLLARGTRAEVTMFHFVTHAGAASVADDARELDQKLALANESIDSLSEIGRSMGATVDASVRFGPNLEDEILNQIARHHYDLLVVGTNIMVGTNRLYLGPTVERLLAQSPCPVLVLNS